jgi:tRNA threonylcarbamoyladenosine biosynthesis protein TsaB
VGLASAKGICYALNIPLIAISTLKMIASAVKEEKGYDFICPLIDARRMEVFTALYDMDLVEKNPPEAIILDEASFSALLKKNKILFCGNGNKKLQEIITSPNALFNNTVANASHFVKLSYEHFINKDFANLAYTDPLYIKEFFSPAAKSI